MDFDRTTHAPPTGEFPSFSTSLLARAQARDRRAHDQLIDIYGPLVYRWSRAWMAPAEASDVVQEVFLAVFRGIDRFRRDRPGSTSLGWLRTITRRKLIDAARARRGTPPGAGGPDAHRRLLVVPDPREPLDADTDAAEPGEWQAVLRNALEVARREVQTSTWQAFWRTVIEQQPTREVAAALGMTTASVRHARFRVLRRLRTLLGEDTEFSPLGGPPTG